MDGENTTGAQVLPMLIPIDRPKRASIPVVPDECRECRKRVAQLTRFIHMAAEIADELDG